MRASRVPDPYRVLGVQRGATDAQVKAAHRRLAKRFHPDAPEGDTGRFLSVQEAYLLLSDPLRRRDWDAAHAPGPVRAGEPARPHGGRATSRGDAAGSTAHEAGPSARWTREPGEAAPRRGATASSRPPGASREDGATPRAGAGGAAAASGSAGDAREERRRPGGAWSASERDPTSRSATWSAAGVPWWEDFTPRGGAAHGDPAARPDGGAHGPGPGAGASAASRPTAPRADAGSGTGGFATAARSPDDVDVYVRSSGAAWSMAARRYFRKGEEELPRGGAFRYRGTQVVTGGEARKAAAEEAASRRAGEEARWGPGEASPPETKRRDDAPRRGEEARRREAGEARPGAAEEARRREAEARPGTAEKARRREAQARPGAAEELLRPRGAAPAPRRAFDHAGQPDPSAPPAAGPRDASRSDGAAGSVPAPRAAAATAGDAAVVPGGLAGGPGGGPAGGRPSLLRRIGQVLGIAR